MPTLQTDLQAACDSLFAKHGTIITPDDIPKLEERVWNLMRIGKGLWVLDKVNITLDDKAEFVGIEVQSGKMTASIELEWRDARGNYWVRVDTDGDGK